VFYALLAFLLLSLLSFFKVIFGDVPAGHKVLASIRYATYGLISFFTFAIARFAIASRLSHATVYFCYMSGVVVLALILLLMYQFGGAPNAIHWDMEPPVGTHMRMMGIMASVAVLIAAIHFLLDETKAVFKKGVCLLSLWVSFSFLIWTGSRASLLLVVLMLLAVMAAMAFWSKVSLIKVATLLLVMMLAVPMAAKVSVFPWNGLQRMSQSTQIAPEATGAVVASTESHLNALTSGRMTIWKITWREIQLSPWLGLGPYGYFFIPDRPRLFDHPHNMLLQFMLEWGVPGALLLLGSLLALIWHGVQAMPQAIVRKEGAYMTSGAIVLMLTANAMVDGVYFVAEPLFMLALAYSCFPLLAQNHDASR
jgi:O-antigen ligase